MVVVAYSSGIFGILGALFVVMGYLSGIIDFRKLFVAKRLLKPEYFSAIKFESMSIKYIYFISKFIYKFKILTKILKSK